MDRFYLPRSWSFVGVAKLKTIFGRRLILSPTSKTKKKASFPATVPLSDEPKSLIFYALVKPNCVKKGLRRGASSGALRGRLRRGPLTSRGGAMVARLRRATSILIGSSILTAVAASILCTGAARQYPTLAILCLIFRPTLYPGIFFGRTWLHDNR